MYKSRYSTHYAVPRECIHGVALCTPCEKCRAEHEGEKIRKRLERELRGTRLGKLCGLK